MQLVFTFCTENVNTNYLTFKGMSEAKFRVCIATSATRFKCQPYEVELYCKGALMYLSGHTYYLRVKKRFFMTSL